MTQLCGYRRQAIEPAPRRSFELHAKLREPLIEWYQCLDRLKPRHVVWELPEDSVGSLSGTASYNDRYDLRVLDALVSELSELE